MGYELVNFKTLGDDIGSLIALEENYNTPFSIKHVYYIFDTKEGVRRGFHANIENGIVHVPEKYTSLQSVNAKIIILAKEMVSNTTFYPSVFFASTHVSKKEIDAYLDASKDEWQ